MDHLKLTVDVLSVEAISDLVVDDSCGAVSIFVGTTRDNFEGKQVVRLEYEAYEPMALKAMKSICDEVRERWPAVHGIAIHHRLGDVPCREASVVIAASSPHRRAALDAVAHCVERLKASVPVWKREVYAPGDAPVWKENRECPSPPPIDKNLVQITVPNDELQQRIQNFIQRKREQVNVSNIHDFTPRACASETEDSCARVRTQFVKRSDSKGHLKIRKVHNEWGPLTARSTDFTPPARAAVGLPECIAERVLAVEHYVGLGDSAGPAWDLGGSREGLGGPVPKDVYRRLKEVEDRVALLQAVSPEYAQFWKQDNIKQEPTVDYTYSADDIARKIEKLEQQGMTA